jgi:putative flippase GtrA
LSSRPDFVETGGPDADGIFIDERVRRMRDNWTEGWILALRSGVASAGSTLLEYAVYLLLAGVLAVQYLAASVVASAVGLTAGFVTNKYWAFSAGGGRVLDHLWRYLVVVGVGIAYGLVLLWLLVDHVGVPYYIARVFSDALAFATWMLPAQRHWVYASRPGDSRNRVRVIQHRHPRAAKDDQEEHAGP